MERINKNIIILSAIMAFILTQSSSAFAWSRSISSSSSHRYHDDYSDRYNRKHHRQHHRKQHRRDHRRKHYDHDDYQSKKHYDYRHYRHDDNQSKKHHDHHHDYKHYGLVKHLPHGAVIVRVGNVYFHYHQGAYYRKCLLGYDIVAAPLGACIRRLPHGYQVHHAHGKRYYSHGDAYYEKTPSGYLVVERPNFDVVFDYGKNGNHFSFSFIR